MQPIIDFPHSMWISQHTIRFAFKEEISLKLSRGPSVQSVSETAATASPN